MAGKHQEILGEDQFPDMYSNPAYEEAGSTPLAPGLVNRDLTFGGPPPNAAPDIVVEFLKHPKLAARPFDPTELE